MADQQRTSKVLCKYFLSNCCKKGDSCAFSHDRSAPANPVCRYYQKGDCYYGQRCRYDHDRRRTHQTNPGRVSGNSSPPKAKDSTSPSEASRQRPPPRSFPEKRDPKVPVASFLAYRNGLKESEPLQSKPVCLSKGAAQSKVTSPASCASRSISKIPDEWVKAKEFVPGQFYTGAVPPTYASAVGPAQSADCAGNTWEKDVMQGAVGGAYSPSYDTNPGLAQVDNANIPCPFMVGSRGCQRTECPYSHWEVCDMCGEPILHPTDKNQRQEHYQECMEAHERDMEHSFKVAASQKMTCGICMDVVLEKEDPSARRFGILQNCNHCFCLNCIRQWRCAEQFKKVIVRACPECRVMSDFVTPSQLWVDSPEEKTKLIEGYKSALREKPCRHFNQGKGDCPFNESCFYKHALPDGTVAPPKPRERRRIQNDEGESVLLVEHNLWDFLEHRDLALGMDEDEFPIELMNYLALADILQDVLGVSSDGSGSEDSIDF